LRLQISPRRRRLKRELSELRKNSTYWSASTLVHATPSQKEDCRVRKPAVETKSKTARGQDQYRRAEPRQSRGQTRTAPRQYAEGWPEQCCHRRQPRSDEGNAVTDETVTAIANPFGRRSDDDQPFLRRVLDFAGGNYWEQAYNAVAGTARQPSEGPAVERSSRSLKTRIPQMKRRFCASGDDCGLEFSILRGIERGSNGGPGG
jgi:hypothetical protein